MHKPDKQDAFLSVFLKIYVIKNQAHSVDLEAKIDKNSFGGLGILDTSTAADLRTEEQKKQDNQSVTPIGDKPTGGNGATGNTQTTTTKVTAPKKGTVAVIGAKAFSGCKKLKKITVKSKTIKKVGKNAFENIHKKCVIKVPASKLKKYKKLMNKKGQAKTVKIKK